MGLLLSCPWPGRGQATNPRTPDFTRAPEIPGFRLVWQDEFNTDGRPDSTHWRYEQGFVRNKELQWYQPENAYCRGGVLRIEGRRETVTNPAYRPDGKDWRQHRKQAEYTSACLETRGLQSFHFGRIEVRARIDTALGAWPAIWTLGVSGTWPEDGEVDIMEYYRVAGRPTILANTAWGDGSWNTQRHPLSKVTGGDTAWAAQFHIWRMDWSRDSISLYLDGQRMNTTRLAGTHNRDGSNPFLQPHYLLLNLAIGALGGDPAGTSFPITYEVDYVRYYQKQ